MQSNNITPKLDIQTKWALIEDRMFFSKFPILSFSEQISAYMYKFQNLPQS